MNKKNVSFAFILVLLTIILSVGFIKLINDVTDDSKRSIETSIEDEITDENESYNRDFEDLSELNDDETINQIDEDLSTLIGDGSSNSLEAIEIEFESELNSLFTDFADMELMESAASFDRLDSELVL